MEDDQHISLLFLIIGNQIPPAHYTSKHMGFKAFKTKTLQQYTNTKLTSTTTTTRLMWNKQHLKFLQEDNHEQTPTELPEAQTSRVGTGFIKLCQRARQ